jgi:plasmid stabilization system protein ParE
MAWRIIMHPKASRDVQNAISWYGIKRKSAEARWRQRLYRALLAIARDPHRYPQSDDAPKVGMDLRESILGRKRGIAHRILFTIDGHVVTIRRIRHASQDELGEDDF